MIGFGMMTNRPCELMKTCVEDLGLRIYEVKWVCPLVRKNDREIDEQRMRRPRPIGISLGGGVRGMLGWRFRRREPSQ